MRRALAVCCACLIWPSCLALGAAQKKGAVRVTVNGKQLTLKTAAVLRKGKPWVPAEEVSKKLGGHVKVIRPGKLIGLCLGETRCRPLKVGAADGAVILKGIVFAPAAVVAEALDAKSSWNAKARTISFAKKRLHEAHRTP